MKSARLYFFLIMFAGLLSAQTDVNFFQPNQIPLTCGSVGLMAQVGFKDT